MDGAKLRAQREALHLTQAQLATELGVTANTVARWERNEIRIGNPRLVEMAIKSLREGLQMTYKGMSITITETNITEGWPEVEGVDQAATCQAWAEALTTELQKAYPGAEISVACRPNEYGPGRTYINGIDPESDLTEGAVKAEITDICDRLMNDSDSWTVMEAAAGITERVLVIMQGWSREAGLEPGTAADYERDIPGSLGRWTWEDWLKALEANDPAAILEGRRVWGLPALV